MSLSESIDTSKGTAASAASAAAKKTEKSAADAQAPGSAPVAAVAGVGKTNYGMASILCLLIAFGGFCFGWDTGTISGFVNMPDFINRFGSLNPDTGKMELTEVRTGLIVSFFNIGCAFGCLSLSKLADIYGRRPALIITMAIYIVGVVIQIAASRSWAQYFVGRIIAGLAVGSTSVLCPMFISETSPKKIRGALVSCYQLMVTAGIFVGYCVCFGTYHNYTNSAEWRIPLGLCFLWAIFMMTGMAFMPESPRYLVSKGRIEAAKRSIARVNKAPVNSDFVQREYLDIATSIERERKAGSASWKELVVGKPKILYRVVTGSCLNALQQLTGCNYFFYYGTLIFKAVGLEDSFLTSIILGAVNFASTFISLWSVDKLGRRKTLMMGSTGMLLCLVCYASIGVAALYPGEYGVNPNKSVGDAMIFLACFFIFWFAITWGPCAFVVVSEMFPLRIKAKAMGLAQGANWLMNFLIAFFTPMISDKIHFAFGFVFFGFNLFALVFVYLCIPETKGLTLEDVDELYVTYKPGISAIKGNKAARDVLKAKEAKQEAEREAQDAATAAAANNAV